MRRSRVFLITLALAACTNRQSEPQTPLGRAAEFLWRQQGEDGGWHSRTYGLLRTGQSLTPFVLVGLLEVPSSAYLTPRDKVNRAIEFIRNHVRSDGSAGMEDPTVPDYPNYATALSISALAKAQRGGWEKQVAPMIAYLRTQQFAAQNSWQPQDPAFGAWGMGGGRRTPPDTGHVDLSMTRYVIEAFRAAGVPTSDPALVAARVFVERCQNYQAQEPGTRDGGFFFSTTEFDTNKAGHDGKTYRSYGTTTADGILALTALGAMPDNPRLAAAGRWLAARHHGIRTPGFTGEPYQRWIQGLAFYYSAASTAAFQVAGMGSAPGVAEDLRKLQKPDGSWANLEKLVKEDDPLIATGFAVRALAR